MLGAGLRLPVELAARTHLERWEMKKFSVAFVILLAFAPGAAGQVKWFKGTFPEALKEAEKRDTLVMVDFYTTWCGWCKKLTKDTFGNKKVGNALADFLCIKLNAEKEGKALSRKHGVEGFPTVVFLLPTGRQAGRIGGYLGPKEFLAEVAKIREAVSGMKAVEKKLGANPEDPELNFRMAGSLKKTNPEKAIECYGKVIASDKGNRSGLADDAHFHILEVRARRIRARAVQLMKSALSAVSLKGRELPQKDDPALGKEFGGKLESLRQSCNGHIKKMRDLIGPENEKSLREITSKASALMNDIADRFLAFAEANPESNMHSDAIESAAEFYFMARDADKAVALYERLEKESSKDPRFLVKYANLLANVRRDPEKARQLAEKAIKLDPKSVNAYTTLAQVEYSRGNAKRALELQKTAVKLNPNSPQLNWRLRRYQAAANTQGAGK